MKKPRLQLIRRAARIALVFLTAAAIGASSGCAFKVIRPQTLTVRRSPDRPPETVHYPMKILVHDEDAFWDHHQIKSNIIGLTELEPVRVADLLADTLIPGPEHRPVENSIEWIKNAYAQLPDWALVRIVGEFFWALGLERTCAARGSIVSPLRIIYLVEWGRFTLNECNRVAGYAVPGRDTLIPKSWTAYPDGGVVWLDHHAIGLNIFIVQALDWCFDRVIDGEESVYAGVVWVLVRSFVHAPRAAPAAQPSR